MGFVSFTSALFMEEGREILLDTGNQSLLKLLLSMANKPSGGRH